VESSRSRDKISRSLTPTQSRSTRWQAMVSHGDPAQLTAQLRSQLRDYIGFTGAINSTLKSINQIQSELDDDKKPINLVKGRLDKSYDTLEEQANDEMRYVSQSNLLFSVFSQTLGSLIRTDCTCLRTDESTWRSSPLMPSWLFKLRWHSRITSFQVRLPLLSALLRFPRPTQHLRILYRERTETKWTKYEEAESRQLFCCWVSHSFCRPFSSTNLRFASWISRQSCTPTIKIRFYETNSPPALSQSTHNLCSSSSVCSTFASSRNPEEIDDQRSERSTTSTVAVETWSSDRSAAVEEIDTWRCAWRLDFREDPHLLTRRQEQVSLSSPDIHR